MSARAHVPRPGRRSISRWRPIRSIPRAPILPVRDLTPEDIRRYIGVRGEAYLYFRQKLPGWEPVLTFVAFVLRSLKRIETLASSE